MDIEGVIWLEHIVEKLAAKHQVEPDEVEQVLNTKPRVQRIERGDVDGEDLYAAVGRTDAGRSLIVFFIYKRTREALVISARETTRKEQRRYGKK